MVCPALLPSTVKVLLLEVVAYPVRDAEALRVTSPVPEEAVVTVFPPPVTEAWVPEVMV